MECRTTSSAKRRQAGLTVAEFVISSGLGLLLATALVGFSIFSGRSLLAMSNHLELNEQARAALDQMTREIRQCQAVTAYTTNSLTLTDVTGTPVTFTYNPSTKKLSRTRAGSSRDLLTGCDRLTFELFMRQPQTGSFDLYPTVVPSEAKAVRITWDCSRTFLAPSVNAANTTSATVVLRMK